MKARVPWQKSKAEEKAMMDEIHRQILITHEKFSNDFDAMVLYTLHTHLGFGKERLRRFYEAFFAGQQQLIKHYEMPGDNAWLCDQKLKEIGIDVKQWNEEMKHVKD